MILKIKTIYIYITLCYNTNGVSILQYMERNIVGFALLLYLFWEDN